jgi:two-component system chemotaxis response regulator CheB
MSAPSKQALRVFLVVGPAARRWSVAENLVSIPDTALVGKSEDPLVLMDPANSHQLDMVVLETGTSRVDAVLLLRRVAQATGAPVVVLSDSASLGSAYTLSLFEAGAIDVLPGLPQATPSKQDSNGRLQTSLRQLTAVLRQRNQQTKGSGSSVAPRVRGDARVQLPAEPSASGRKPDLAGVETKRIPAASDTGRFNARQVIVLGASTGGTEAIKDVLTVLPAEMPGICIVQHIPAVFSRSFAQRLNSLCALEVREAEHGDLVRPGLVLVAPGGFHMELRWERTQYVVRLHRGPEEHHQRPAVDVLFRSAAVAAGPHAIGVLLTGMGKDGALGMQAIKEAGGINLAQDDKSCVVFGMPAAAQELGVVHHVVSLKDMAGAIQHRARIARAAFAA